MVSALVSSRTMKTEAIICLFCLCYNICQAYSSKLLYTNRKEIRIVQNNHKNRTATETIVVDGLDGATAVDFFFAEGYVFWTDDIKKKIKRIPFRGKTRNVEDVISLGLRRPEGLAVDWVARKLYWTDCGDSYWLTSKIEVANLDGTNRKVLFWKKLGLPRAIAVDPLYGLLFWTDWGEEPKIERAEMDASNRQSIIQQDIYWPNGLTIDYSARKIYWTDAKLYYINKANYDGSSREKVFKSPAQCTLGHPFDLTLHENKIYWTGSKTSGIPSSNKNTGRQCQNISSNAYARWGIWVFEPKRQQPRPGKNPCNSTTNGGCSHLCLLNTNGRSCACPTGFRLMIDKMTCEQAEMSEKAIAAIAVSVACLCLLFLVAVVCWWRLKQRKKETSLDPDFKFDAFIIYSTVDQKWVTKELLPTLESKHKIKCCIHYRDFVPGVPFTKNMADSVYNSKKTVAVVSKSFLTSNFCSHELSIALHRLAERGDDSVVVVKLDDVKSSQLPKELRFRSYIDFTKSTDKSTWEYKLVNCLKSRTSRPPFLC